jgi:hypothetical protein
LNGQPLTMELRNRVRYRLSADAIFAWEGAQHGRLLGKGVTRDISLTGAFIFTSTCPPVGATVELDVFLYPVSGAVGKRVQIRTKAKVIRVEHSAETEGFAAVSQDFTLLFDSNGRNRFSISSAEENDQSENEESRHGIPTQALYEALIPLVGARKIRASFKTAL